MKISKRCIIFLFCVVSGVFGIASADELMPDHDKPLLISAENRDFKETAEMKVEIANDIENSDKETVSTEYDENGMLKKACYEDGTKARYSYKYDVDGSLTSVNINHDGDSFVFSVEKDGLILTIDDLPDRKKLAENKRKTDPDSVEDGPRTITYPGPGRTLEEIAKKPLPMEFYKDVKKALEQFEKSGKDGRKEFERNVNEYYEKTREELVKRSGPIEAEGIDVIAILAEPEKSVPKTEEKRREAIDKAVAHVKAEAERSGIPKTSAMEFLGIEKRYNYKFLRYAEEIRDQKTEKALLYLRSVIEELNNSKLAAIYLRSKNGTIRGVIKLPEAKKNHSR